MISWNDFEKIDIRSGTIMEAKVLSGLKKPAFQLLIDFGALGRRKSSAQITARYIPENLIGSQVVAVVNFPVKQIGNFMSECLVLGVYNEQNEVILLRPDQTVTNGSKIG